MFINSYDEYKAALKVDNMSEKEFQRELKQLEKEGRTLIRDYLKTLDDA